MGETVIPPNDMPGQVQHAVLEGFQGASFLSNVLDPVARTAAALNLGLMLEA